MPTIRDSCESDSDQLWGLLERSLAEYGLRPDRSTTDSDLMDVQASYMEKGGRFRVLVENGKVIGMCGLYNKGDAVAELRKMYLDPSFKGKGYGKMLLEDALEIARKCGFRQMVLETNLVLVEAIGMYKKYGFIEVEQEVSSVRCNCAMALDL